MSRPRRKEVAEEHLALLEKGEYSCDGQSVNIKAELTRAIETTVTICPDEFARIKEEVEARAPVCEKPIELAITSESTTDAVFRLAKTTPPEKLVCLNFASAKNPGGGFLSGAAAQEEALARSSGLYQCLVPQTKYYEANRPRKGGVYTEHQIYSSLVPFIREDTEEFKLVKPVYANIITAPAVNVGAMKKVEEKAAAPFMLKDRAENLLDVCAYYQNEVLILGAWGTGCFRNDPYRVAVIFKDLLKLPKYQKTFKQVVFAIKDSAPCKTLGAFQKVFGLEERKENPKPRVKHPKKERAGKENSPAAPV